VQTTPTNPDEQPTKSRRTFLKTTAGALFAGAALPQAKAGINRFGADYAGSNYIIGLVLNPALAGPLGELILNVYLSVDGDGAGIGLLTDPLHPALNSYLAVRRSVQKGNQFIFDGVVSRANTPALVGLPFAVAAEVHAEFTTLDLVFNGATFSGQGARAGYIDPISDI
jgi:hypothetical protein